MHSVAILWPFFVFVSYLLLILMLTAVHNFEGEITGKFQVLVHISFMCFLTAQDIVKATAGL